MQIDWVFNERGRLSTDEKRFRAELVFKKQKNTDDTSDDMIDMSVSHASEVDSNNIDDANKESENKDIDHTISEN